jgi:hypothetical protein
MSQIRPRLRHAELRCADERGPDKPDILHSPGRSAKIRAA